jgi:hypothetical protein
LFASYNGINSINGGSPDSIATWMPLIMHLFILTKKPEMAKELILNLIFMVIMVSSCHQMAEPETYLTPDGYTGRVEILFDL